MRLVLTSVTVGVAVLIGCSGPPAESVHTKPVGDHGTPADEFQMAHEAVVQLTSQMDALRASNRPDQTMADQPEAVDLAKAVSAAQWTAGRLGYEVAQTDLTGRLGADGLYSCLLYSFDGITQRRAALDLAVQHHPHDPRLGEYLYAVLGDRVPGHVREWMDPVLDRVLADSRNPAVLAAAQTGRGRLMLGSPDPAVVAAGERLLESVLRQYPDETVGTTRVVTWVNGVLTDHNRFRGAVSSPTVRLRP